MSHRWIRQGLRTPVDHPAEARRLTELAERNEENAERIAARNGETEVVTRYRETAKRQREQAARHR